MTTANLAELQPASYRALFALHETAERAAADAGLPPVLVELVKIRASQLNGCAYCLRTHSRDAVAKGETVDRLALVTAWWESQYFTDAERAALILTERTTDLPGTGPRHGADLDPAEVLDGAQYAAVLWLVVVINAWNRVAVGGHVPVTPD